MKRILERWIALLQEWGKKDEGMPEEKDEMWLGAPRALQTTEREERPIFSGKAEGEETRGQRHEPAEAMEEMGRADRKAEGEGARKTQPFVVEESAEKRVFSRFWDRDIVEEEGGTQKDRQWFSSFDTKQEKNSVFQGEGIAEYIFSDTGAETEKKQTAIGAERGLGAQEVLLHRIYGILAKEKDVGTENSPRISLQVGQVGGQQDLDGMIQALSKRLWEERQSSRRKVKGE